MSTVSGQAFIASNLAFMLCFTIEISWWSLSRPKLQYVNCFSVGQWRWNSAMEEQEQPRSLRRKLMRNSLFIFIGFVFIVLCFVFLGVAQQQQHITEEYCKDCHGSNKPRVFRILAAICFVFGITLMAVSWWHMKAIRSAYVLRQRRLELERLIGNNNHRVRRANTVSLGLRNSAWYGLISAPVQTRQNTASSCRPCVWARNFQTKFLRDMSELSFFFEHSRENIHVRWYFSLFLERFLWLPLHKHGVVD